MKSKTDLEEIIKEKLKEKENRKRIREEEKRKLEGTLFEEKKYEDSHIDKKVELFSEIDSWTREFSQSSMFSDLLKISRFSRESIEVYGGGWGHKRPKYDGYGCWSYVNLYEGGRLEYRGGYKWMGASTHFDLTKRSIGKLSLDYWEKFHDSIKSEKVYGRFERYVEQCSKYS